MTDATAATPRKLRFANVDEAIAEIQRLRKGCTRAGNWSLAQACWHLNTILRYLMKPGEFPPDTAEQQARRPIFERILATGEIPSGIQAPEHITPPADCDASAIDALIEALTASKSFAGPFAPHRLFGNLTHDEMTRHNLIHCARHLGHLIPTAGA